MSRERAEAHGANDAAVRAIQGNAQRGKEPVKWDATHDSRYIALRAIHRRLLALQGSGERWAGVRDDAPGYEGRCQRKFDGAVT